MRIRKFSKPLTISFHPEVFEQVKQITDVQARSMADWIREVVDHALSRQKDEQSEAINQSSANGGK